jgi:hypothetical protein
LYARHNSLPESGQLSFKSETGEGVMVRYGAWTLPPAVCVREKNHFTLHFGALFTGNPVFQKNHKKIVRTAQVYYAKYTTLLLLLCFNRKNGEYRTE